MPQTDSNSSLNQRSSYPKPTGMIFTFTGLRKISSSTIFKWMIVLILLASAIILVVVYTTTPETSKFPIPDWNNTVVLGNDLPQFIDYENAIIGSTISPETNFFLPMTNRSTAGAAAKLSEFSVIISKHSNLTVPAAKPIVTKVTDHILTNNCDQILTAATDPARNLIFIYCNGGYFTIFNETSKLQIWSVLSNFNFSIGPNIVGNSEQMKITYSVPTNTLFLFIPLYSELDKYVNYYQGMFTFLDASSPSVLSTSVQNSVWHLFNTLGTSTWVDRGFGDSYMSFMTHTWQEFLPFGWEYLMIADFLSQTVVNTHIPANPEQNNYLQFHPDELHTTNSTVTVGYFWVMATSSTASYSGVSVFEVSRDVEGSKISTKNVTKPHAGTLGYYKSWADDYSSLDAFLPVPVPDFPSYAHPLVYTSIGASMWAYLVPPTLHPSLGTGSSITSGPIDTNHQTEAPYFTSITYDSLSGVEYDYLHYRWFYEYDPGLIANFSEFFVIDNNEGFGVVPYTWSPPLQNDIHGAIIYSKLLVFLPFILSCFIVVFIVPRTNKIFSKMYLSSFEDIRYSPNVEYDPFDFQLLFKPKSTRETISILVPLLILFFQNISFAFDHHIPWNFSIFSVGNILSISSGIWPRFPDTTNYGDIVESVYLYIGSIGLAINYLCVMLLPALFFGQGESSEMQYHKPWYRKLLQFVTSLAYMLTNLLFLPIWTLVFIFKKILSCCGKKSYIAEEESSSSSIKPLFNPIHYFTRPFNVELPRSLVFASIYLFFPILHSGSYWNACESLHLTQCSSQHNPNHDIQCPNTLSDNTIFAAYVSFQAFQSGSICFIDSFPYFMGTMLSVVILILIVFSTFAPFTYSFSRTSYFSYTPFYLASLTLFQWSLIVLTRTIFPSSLVLRLLMLCWFPLVFAYLTFKYPPSTYESINKFISIVFILVSWIYMSALFAIGFDDPDSLYPPIILLLGPVILGSIYLRWYRGASKQAKLHFKVPKFSTLYFSAISKGIFKAGIKTIFFDKINLEIPINIDESSRFNEFGDIIDAGQSSFTGNDSTTVLLSSSSYTD